MFFSILIIGSIYNWSNFDNILITCIVKNIKFIKRTMSLEASIYKGYKECKEYKTSCE